MVLTAMLSRIVPGHRMPPNEQNPSREETNGRTLPTDEGLPKKLDLGVTLTSEAEPSGPMTLHIDPVRKAGRFAKVAVAPADQALKEDDKL
jgi:hypothetical protein